ncbi:MAG: universal stress protein [bacterium]|nr:universal stress protein [bacterium]
MAHSFLLAVDGSEGSHKAVEFAIDQAKRSEAEIILAYVIEWSPYAFNTPEENENRHKRREEELEQAKKVIVSPVAAELREAGLTVKTEVQHGNPGKTLIDIAKSNNVSQMFIGRHGESGIKTLLFGSIAANLIQSSPIPVTVVP